MSVEIAKRGIEYTSFESGSKAYANQVKGLMFGEHEAFEIAGGQDIEIGDNGYVTLRTQVSVVTIQIGEVIQDKRPRLRPFMSPTNVMLMCELVGVDQARIPFQFKFSSGLSLQENLLLLAEHVNVLTTPYP